MITLHGQRLTSCAGSPWGLDQSGVAFITQQVQPVGLVCTGFTALQQLGLGGRQQICEFDHTAANL